MISEENLERAAPAPPENKAWATELGIVLIGRNEGERLKASIRSVLKSGVQVVYVDSGSTDGSTAFAASHGVAVVDLDLSIPFTAARARNTGLAELVKRLPGVQFVHFIDGDCALEPGWLAKAMSFLSSRPDVAVVCGIRQEIKPDASLYNWICNIEWNQPAGETTACGGDALFRVAPFQEVGGFNPALLAGEEPELCIRLREKGWKIWRLADPMTRHDAAMTRFGQYWKRAVRSGYGQARVAMLHGKSRSGIWMRESLRPLAYVCLPVISLVLVMLIGVWGLLPLAIFPLQVTRIALRMGAADWRSWGYGTMMMVAKFAETQGMLALVRDLMTGHTRKIIEYK